VWIKLVAGVLAALVAGTALGAVARGLMTLVALATGAVFLCVPAVGVAGAEIGGTAGFDAVQWLGVGAGTVALFGTIALLPLVTVRLTDRWLGRRPLVPAVAVG
jgi:hypothetical protein